MSKIFKECTACHVRWNTRTDFLEDPTTALVGYQVNYGDLEAGFFLFNHDTPACETTMALPADKFTDMHDGPIFEGHSREDAENCPGYCSDQTSFRECKEECECAYVRDVLTKVKEWPKGKNNEPRGLKQGAKIASVLLALSLAVTAHAQFANPFSASADIQKIESGRELSVSFTVPEKHYLYESAISITADESIALLPHSMPASKPKKDPVSGEIVRVYAHDVTLVYRVDTAVQLPFSIKVKYQGCDDTQCFFPQSQGFTLGESGTTQSATTELNRATDNEDWREVAEALPMERKCSGYMKSDDFIAFLDGTEVDDGIASADISQSFEERSILLIVIFILLGGLALNLTPCILPMIPVNLAIIGAGTQSDGSKRRGLLLGATYGLGIAGVYGLLGLAAVLTGAKFGSINSSPWFNAAITILFFVLSLAMFGVFNLDFTRLQAKVASPSASGRGSFMAALIMGGVAALLAGACVAPPVISVLLLSTDLYHKGNAAALLLPFVLGIGMALPWPFAGAGLSFLPKPGRWMEKVKYLFGIIILLTSLYYGAQSYKLFTRGEQETPFRNMLVEAQASGKPILIDFWASWCKNCSKMESKTFHDPAVQERLSSFFVIKYQAEDLNDPTTSSILDYYGVPGLPTYVILKNQAE